MWTSGARLPSKSDTAGAQPFACNPWFTMHSMVNRLNKNRLTIDEGEAVTVEEAIRAFTIDAACALGHEHSRGTIAPGKFADLAVLTLDPLTIPTTQLPEVTSTLCLIGGEIAFTDQTLDAAHR
jgi:predicted amidohydrolase YtcJ